ncbi:MAG: c-type cytochrome biogenesis protein CcsB [Coriobacteriia bacterium]|nr:c-type cytochrome biogenesis protein CcsB [Coriobacteriia bacterium]
MSLATEIVLIWSTVMVYALSTVLFVAGTVFTGKRLLAAGLIVASSGLALQTAAFAVRWARVGHAPFLGFYEVVAAYAYATVATVVFLGWWRPQLRPLGAVLMPISLLALGAAMLADRTDEIAGGTLASWWLTVHVLFAKLSYSAFIVAFALAVAYLLRDRHGAHRTDAILNKLPDQDVVDDLAYRAAAVGLVFLSVMVVAGAIWANEAWGRYWAWDPVETWSLVTWLVYSIFLHLRLTMGWRGRRSAWVLVAALPVVAFSFVVVPVVYNSIHGAYLQGL